MNYERGVFHKASAFYFRGDDPKYEENLKPLEIKKLKNKLNERKKELEKIINEHNILSRQLKSKDQTIKYSSMETGDLSAVHEQNLRKRIQTLNEKINLVEKETLQVKDSINHFNFSKLCEEQLSLKTSIDDINNSNNSMNESIKDYIDQLSNLYISNNYLLSNNIIGEINVGEAFKNRIQTHINNIRKTINQNPSNKNSKRDIALSKYSNTNRKIVNLLNQKIEKQLQKSECELHKTLAALHRKHMAEVFCSVIVELNSFLDFLGIDNNFNLEEIRAKSHIDEL